MPLIPRRATKSQILLKKSIVQDALLVLITFCAAILGSIDKGKVTTWSVLLSLSALAIGLAKFVSQGQTALNEAQNHDLAGCLHTLLAALDGTKKPEEGEPCLRATIYVSVKCKSGRKSIEVTELERLLPYVGNQRNPEDGGQRYPANVGIIGKAFSNKSAYVASRKSEDYAQYVEELQREWNFPKEMAERIASGPSRDWMAVALAIGSEDDEAEGVVFVDSTISGFLTPERADLVGAACGGIAKFVNYRYKPKK